MDVNAALSGAVPQSMIQAGRSLADVALDLMAAVNRVETARAAEREAKAEAEALQKAEQEKTEVSPEPVEEPSDMQEQAAPVEDAETAGEAPPPSAVSEAPVEETAPYSDKEI